MIIETARCSWSIRNVETSLTNNLLGVPMATCLWGKKMCIYNEIKKKYMYSYTFNGKKWWIDGEIWTVNRTHVRTKIHAKHGCEIKLNETWKKKKKLKMKTQTATMPTNVAGMGALAGGVSGVPATAVPGGLQSASIASIELGKKRMRDSNDDLLMVPRLMHGIHSPFFCS